MKITSKIAIILASVVAALSITGVAAVWSFYDGAATEASTAESVDIGENWDTTSLLLNTLIEKLNDEDSGLNDCLDVRAQETSNNLIYIIIMAIRRVLGFTNWEERSYYGSMDPTLTSYVDSEITEFLTEYNNYSYIIDFSEESSNRMYIYISDSELGEYGTYDYNGWLVRDYYTKNPGTPTVPVGANRYHIYRTTLDYTNGEWVADADETLVDGYAPSCWYEESMSDHAVIRQIPSYDIANWTAADGTHTQGAIDTAIWTFDGDSTTVTAETADALVYYQLHTVSETYNYTYSSSDDAFTYYGLNSDGDSSGTVNNYFYNFSSGTAGSAHEYKYNAAGNYTITSNSGVTITVYENSVSGSVVSSGTGSVTFTADEATIYYIVLTGAAEMSLAVELAA